MRYVLHPGAGKAAEGASAPAARTLSEATRTRVLTRLRENLEALAASLAARLVTPDQIRKLEELIDKYDFGVTLITKSDLVLRDLELLRRIHAKAKAVVQMTMTTYDEALCRIVEPYVCTTARRFEVLCALRDAGIPTVVWLSPILPYLNDTRENLAGILRYCIRAGVKGIVCFGMGMTLREGNREYYYAALDRHFPGLRQRYEREFGNAYELESPRSGELMRLFHAACEKYGIWHDNDRIFRYLQELPEPYEQMTFF